MSLPARNAVCYVGTRNPPAPMTETRPLSPPPAVSVVIPTYNHADYLPATLTSVFAQIFRDYEVIVVNDGSPDDVAARVCPLAEAGRIRYFEQPNAGQAVARNRGLAEARGEFVAFLDDDDLWPPDHLARHVAILRAEPDVDVVYGQREVLGSDQPPHPGNEAPEGEVLAPFSAQGWIQSPGQAVIRRTALARTGGFDPAIWGTDDWDLWLRLARGSRFRYDPHPALVYRRHATNASKNFLRMWKNGRAVVRKNFRQTRDAGTTRQRRAAERFVDDFAFDDGMTRAFELMSAGQLSAAATALCQVARIRGWRVADGYYLYAWRQLARHCLRGALRPA